MELKENWGQGVELHTRMLNYHVQNPGFNPQYYKMKRGMKGEKEEVGGQEMGRGRGEGGGGNKEGRRQKRHP